MKIVLVLIPLVVACTQADSPALLDRPRVLAVRVDPPTITAGATARVDVLVGDAAGRAAIVTPDAVTAALDGLPAVAARGPDGWTITAPPDAALAAIRTQLGLAATDPVELPLAVEVAVDGEALSAVKVAVVGAPETGVNPVVDGMTFGGTTPTGAAIVPIGDSVLAPGAVTSTGELAYAWYSSRGELSAYRSAQATLTATADDAGDGELVLVVRDDHFGVGWTTADIHVQ